MNRSILSFNCFIFSLPWGVGFGASVGAQSPCSEPLQVGTATPFSGSHLLHWKIIGKESILSVEWMQTKEPVNINFTIAHDRVQNKLKVRKKTEGL